MFLITAVIIIVTLIILVTTSNLTNIIQEKRELEGRFEQEFFSNIVDELVKVIDISYYQSSNITNNVFDFGNFTRKKMIERLLNFEFLYVGSMTPDSSGNVTMNVTVINLLNKPISATLRLNTTGDKEMLPTYAWKLSDNSDVTAFVNKSDNVYATEVCLDDDCSTYDIRINFTTSETWENVTIEWVISETVDTGYLRCWNGAIWSLIASTNSISDENTTASLSGCSNTGGNYTFRVYAIDTHEIGIGLAGVSISIDYIFINRTEPNLKSSEMADYSRWDTNYTITQGKNYILTVGYDGTYEENVTITTKSNESIYVGFFDITLIGSETTYKDKFQKSYTLP